jgi:hypothetical protein
MGLPLTREGRPHQGFFVQVPPVHEHVAAPPQFTVQPPPVQFVIVHDVALLHVSVQKPPVQSIEHVPPVHCVMQLPPVHEAVTHAVVFVHVWMQSPPLQSVVVHVPPVQFWTQSPLVQPPIEHVAFVQF